MEEDDEVKISLSDTVLAVGMRRSCPLVVDGSLSQGVWATRASIVQLWILYSIADVDWGRQLRS